MTLAICAVVRNEIDYIEEWLVFHYLQGVKYFLLFENQSTDATRYILHCLQDKYSDRFIINIQTINENPCQFKAYDRGIEIIKSASYLDSPRYCAFLDCDEFLYSPGGAQLPDILQNYKDASQISVHWVFHGSNGHLTKTPGLVIERFTKRDNKADKHVKAIVRIKDTIKVGRNPHHFLVHGKTVDENGNILKNFYGIKYGGTIDILRIAHFHTKSKEEYFERKKKPDPGTGAIYSKERLEEMFTCHDLNLIEDLSLANWADRVKEEISR